MKKFPAIKFREDNNNTQHRYTSLQKKIGSQRYYDITLPSFIATANIVQIGINSDAAGTKGCSDDIELITETNVILGISLKSNNFSIKHPRPNSIHEKCDMSIEYLYSYNKLNEKWYCSINNYDKFNQMPPNQKCDMYEEFTELLLQYLTSLQQVQKLFCFCTCSKDQYIIVLNRSHQKITTFYIENKFNTFTDFSINRIKNNTLAISLGNIVLKFRLHNAASKITKTLSLKYDVTCDSKLNFLKEIDENTVVPMVDPSISSNLSNAEQCNALTKKNTRCKNKGKYNRYCDRHKTITIS